MRDSRIKEDASIEVYVMDADAFPLRLRVLVNGEWYEKPLGARLAHMLGVQLIQGAVKRL